LICFIFYILTSLEDLKDYIQETRDVKVDHQLLLTAKTAGQLKFEAVSDGQQVYLYDKSKIRDHQVPSDEPMISNPPPPPAPNSADSPQELFKQRAQWAQDCLTIFQSIEPKCSEISEKLEVLRGGVVTARLHMENQSKVLEKSFESRIDFAVALESDLSAMTDWDQTVESLKNIEVPRSTGGGTLHRFVDVELLRRTSAIMEQTHDSARKKMKALSVDVKAIVSQTNELSRAAEALMNPKQSVVKANTTAISDIFQDLEAIVYKIKRDAEYVGSLQNTASSERNASRIQALHDKEFFPQVESLGNEISDLYTQLATEKNSCQRESIAYLRKVSQMQYQTSLIKPRIQEVSQELQDTEESRVVIGRAMDVPFLFGIFMIELARRTKFISELRSTVSTNAEIIAVYGQEEEKRRTKFKKQYNGFSLLDMKDDVPTVDISISANDDSYDQVTVQDLEEYLVAVKQAGLAEEYQELVNEMRDKLDVPKLISKTRAFKSIPVSESFTISSQGEEDPRIKGYVSRIRKLEDLLHREQYKNLEDTSTSRNGPKASSPSRLIQTVHSLEEQRAKDKETIATLEKEIEILKEEALDRRAFSGAKVEQELGKLRSQLDSRIREHADQIESADRMKNDLLANLAAKEAEFNRERKSFLEEISSLREKIDGFEESTIDNQDDLSRLTSELVESKLKANQYESTIDNLKAELAENNRENQHLKQFKEKLDIRSRDLSQRLYTSYKRSFELLESMGLRASKDIDGTSITFSVNRVRGLGRRRSSTKSSELLRDSSGLLLDSEEVDSDKGELIVPTDLLYWMEDSEDDEERYARFMNEVYIDYDIFRDSVVKRFGDMEHLARKLQREVRLSRDKNNKSLDEGRFKISLRNFREGDLVLFLPTRDSTRVPNPWAAFNVGAPHYFLKQAKDHKLETREYLVARITSIEDRIVNKAIDTEEDNPFDLSDGLRWHLLEAKLEW
jgi:autophagy-related protein 11